MAALDAIGVGRDGVWRLAWSPEDEASRAWFFEQAASVGLAPERDPAGNLWACPDQEAPWWGVGSHLDSVRGGGRFDGPLGVACGFEIAATAERPMCVLSFADEEGARFNTPTFGSKALVGGLDAEGVLTRRDEAGTELAQAMRDAGIDPVALGEAPAWLSKLRGLFEIHIDQTTDLSRAGAAVGVVSSLASRCRLEVELTGRADHAGTTPAAERRDALSAAARLIVAAEELGDGIRVTASRIVVHPNAPTTIADRVRLWLDARAADPAALERWTAAAVDAAASLEASTGVRIALRVVSRSSGIEFSCELRAALLSAGRELTGSEPPTVICYAGHDAGVLARRLPAAMVFVRNERGISHSPEETVELEDAALAANVVARTLARMG